LANLSFVCLNHAMHAACYAAQLSQFLASLGRISLGFRWFDRLTLVDRRRTAGAELGIVTHASTLSI
jgi:hypothetical protein